MSGLLKIYSTSILFLAAIFTHLNLCSCRSSIVHHTLHRAAIFGSLPTLKTNSQRWKPLEQYRSMIAHFEIRNFTWLLIIDVCLGVLLGFSIIKKTDTISQILRDYLFKWCILFFETYIGWLMGYPAGLKLNGNLARFLREMHMWLLSLWRGPLMMVPIELVVKVLGSLGLLGLTFILSGMIDLCLILMMPLQISYKIAARLIEWEITTMGSLFHLFRGKKWNVLRGRLDSANYDLDQLLLGTVLFSVLVFVFPTIAVYYSLFFFSICGWSWILMALGIIHCIANTFPIYELWRRRSIVTGLRCEINRNRLTVSFQHKSASAVFIPLRKRIWSLVNRLICYENLKRSLHGRLVNTNPMDDYSRLT